MMLIITNRNPVKNATYIYVHTNKNFLFKSLLELAQLICSRGISNIYKPIKQGKELQEWILKNKLWVYRYFSQLYWYCVGEIKMKPKTARDLYLIKEALYESSSQKQRIRYPKNAIFRYKKGYKSSYKSNSELPLEECMKEYRKYLKEFKFKED